LRAPLCPRTVCFKDIEEFKPVLHSAYGHTPGLATENKGACGGWGGYVKVTDISLAAFDKGYVVGALEQVELTRLGSAQIP